MLEWPILNYCHISVLLDQIFNYILFLLFNYILFLFGTWFLININLWHKFLKN